MLWLVSPDSYMFGAMHDPDSISEQAERNAPYPKIEPSHAGLTGFMITGFAMVIFLAISGIEMEGHTRVALAVYAMIAAGFAGPFIYFNNQKRRHWREWARLDSLARERNA